MVTLPSPLTEYMKFGSSLIMLPFRLSQIRSRSCFRYGAGESGHRYGIILSQLYFCYQFVSARLIELIYSCVEGIVRCHSLAVSQNSLGNLQRAFPVISFLRKLCIYVLQRDGTGSLDTVKSMTPALEPPPSTVQ